jgi:hypothetical protein
MISYDLYDLVWQSISFYPGESKLSSRYNVEALAVYSINPTDTYFITEYTRNSLLSLLSGIGGLMYFLRRQSLKIVKIRSGFYADNSLMRSLYSVDRQ